ncbi:MAG: hypothetical protein KGD64_13180 [Candidatus Heimdallarchaeota archaeon]|nr:hypothetical protein [Candidatus Heimdallarchaeota archaeon]
MKFSKKWLFMLIIGFILFSSFPQSTYGVVFYTDYMPHLDAGNNEEYVLIYKYDTISNDRVIEEDLKSRICRRTPTEFQTVESDDTLITTWDFVYEGRSIASNQTDLVYFISRSYVFIAAEDTTSGNLAIFATFSEDNGRTWEELQWVHNSTVTFDYFLGFGATNLASDLFVAYSYKINPAGTIKFTETLSIDPLSLAVKSETASVDYYGDDFDFYSHENNVYIVSTYENELDEKFVRLTYTTSGTSLTTSALFTSPYGLVDTFEPTVVAWNDGFFVVAHDLILDVYDITQNITFAEYILWGAYISDLADPNTITYHTIVKALAEGYTRKSPSLSLYEGQLFVAFELTEGTQFGGGRPEIAFSFSTNGDTWTDNYMGDFKIYFNPGIFFAIATVGCFAIVLPMNLIVSKTKKK